jgi:hypothetical protein
MHNPWDRCYYEHFTSYFGKPFDLATYNPGDDRPPLHIVTYDKGFPAGCRLYASLGLTAYADEVKERAEVILLTDAGHAEAPFLLVNALFFITRQRIRLDSRFAIGGLDRLAPDFAAQFEKVALYFTAAGSTREGFGRVECEGEEGRLYRALFISEAEHDYLKRHGGEALEEQIEAQLAVLNTKFAAASRPSSV